MKAPDKIFYLNDFIYTDVTDFHRQRGRAILQRYPQVRKLMTTYPLSAGYSIAIIALQIGLGTWLASEPWWLLIAVAFVVGSVASHALFVLLHDTIHNLVFKNKTASKLMAILINVGQGIPSGVSFQEFHIKHHVHFIDYQKDLDIPLYSEAKIIRNMTFFKVLWLLCLGVTQAFRPLGRSMKVLNKWSWINLIAIIITNVLIGYFAGWHALLYIILSSFFGLGIHPLGARWIQEHFVFKEGQQTYSYYGIGNRFAFNVGYHNEHHDLMNIPWINLPKLNRIASEFYKPLYAHTSWVRLYFRFLFDKRISLFNRIVETGTR